MSSGHAERAAIIYERLLNLYPEVRVELDYTTPFELMIASILAAQNTDVNINRLTPTLFRKYRTPADYLAVDVAELEQDIHKSGFFRQKAKAIRGVCERLISDFGGEVPKTMAELLTLPGIGRKTATVILGEAMGIAEGITVDVHHLRLQPRLGFSSQKTAEKIEKDLLAFVPQENWIKFGQLITWHGRRTCKARKPLCGECVINDVCPSANIDG
jgi:endonuclease-3